MKILRRSFGYTTNSSSASEFVLSEDLQRQIEEAKRRKAIENGEIPPGEAVQEEPGAPTTGDSEGGTAPAEQPPAERPSPLLENAMVIGGLLLAVLGVFAIERAVRRTLRRARERNDDV